MCPRKNSRDDPNKNVVVVFNTVQFTQNQMTDIQKLRIISKRF